MNEKERERERERNLHSHFNIKIIFISLNPCHQPFTLSRTPCLVSMEISLKLTELKERSACVIKTAFSSVMCECLFLSTLFFPSPSLTHSLFLSLYVKHIRLMKRPSQLMTYFIASFLDFIFVSSSKRENLFITMNKFYIKVNWMRYLDICFTLAAPKFYELA